MIILRQKEFANAANLIAKKAREMSQAKGFLSSLGYSTAPKDIANAKHVLRARNRAGMTGAEIRNNFSGIKDSLVNKPRTATNINQRINLKTVVAKESQGFQRLNNMKEVMKGNRWEVMNVGELGQPGIPYMR